MFHSGRLPRLVAAGVFALAGLGAGCTGQVGPSPDGTTGPNDPSNPNNPNNPANPNNPNNPNNPSNPNNPPPAGNKPDMPGYSVFRRLSRVEYDNTLRDLLGDNSAPGKGFPADLESEKSGFRVGSPVSHADAGHLFNATEAVTTAAMGRLAEILPCKAVPAAPADQDMCARDFVNQFGKRAFRRPLTKDESAKLIDFYGAQRTAGADFANAIRLTMAAMLLSPQFLYRWETNPQTTVRDGGLIRHNGYEMASRLSYLLWASMPDETGFGLADQNKLGTPAEIEAEARRMLKDPKAKGAVADFFAQWLGITALDESPKDPKVYPEFTPALIASMQAETAAFAGSVVVDGDGKLATVFTSSKSFIDANLAKLYGLGVTSATPTATDLNPGERGGILTHASFLAGHASADESSPPRRGKVMADKVLCTPVAPPPDPDNVPTPPDPRPGVSVRERFEEHGKQACAVGCHSILDPLGYAFEHYNGIGAYQSMDAGKPVNASGVLKIDGGEKPFKNALELGKILAGSPQIADCMARQFLRYALRRHEQIGDEASIAAAVGAATKNDNNLRELLVALTKTRSFTHRTPSAGEVLP